MRISLDSRVSQERFSTQCSSLLFPYTLTQRFTCNLISLLVAPNEDEVQCYSSQIPVTPLLAGCESHVQMHRFLSPYLGFYESKSLRQNMSVCCIAWCVTLTMKPKHIDLNFDFYIYQLCDQGKVTKLLCSHFIV